MPGPRGKVKAKSKARNTSGSSSQVSAPDPVVGDMDDAEGWNTIVSILCDHLKLPDLRTRKGLKKIHRDFDAIYRRLDKLYEKNSANEKVVGAVVGIYSKMCADALLRDKLFKAGFLSRLLPLLDMPTCIHLALHALTNITHHGGVEARTEIARETPILVDLIRKHPEDDRIAEYCITIMSHSIDAITGNSEHPPNSQLVRALNMSEVLKVFVETAKRADASSSLISHTIEFLARATLHYYQFCETNPDVLNLLVATLHSSDLTARCSSLGGILRLHHHDAEVEKRYFDHQKTLAAVQRRYPDHLVEILGDYGFEQSDMVIQLKVSVDYQNAFMQCMQDRDIYTLGLTLANIIPRTEFSVGKGAFQTEDTRTGVVETVQGSQLGLPFNYWDDALPHCAKAIRAVGKAGEEDLADILDTKYHILKGNIPLAIDHAKRALKRNPDHAYFYYAISLGKDPTDGLRFSKKGLKCKETTPFVRFQLMQRAVGHAGDMGLSLLQEARVGDHKWAEGIAFLTSALEDARIYVEEAPPDNRHMRRVLYWRILLDLAINGHNFGDDLRELQRTIRALKFADDFGAFVGEPPTKTELYHAQKTILSLYPEAIKEWSPVIARFDQVRTTEEPIVSTEKVEEDLAAWLDELHMEDGTREVLQEDAHATFTTGELELYRCSWCGNPSAILKKCSRCTKTRYCDASCQRSHWSTHKAKCSEGAKE